MYQRFADFKHHSDFKGKYNPEEREAKRRKIEQQYSGDLRELLFVVLEKAEKSRIKFPKPYILFGINK